MLRTRANADGARSASRGWVWLQLVAAWLPMWALFTALIMLAHHMPVTGAAIGAFRMIASGALLGLGVYRFAARMPWPRPFRASFIAIHVLAAAAYALCWYVLISVIDSIVLGHLAFASGPGIGISLVTGVWLYFVVASVAYANLAARRTAILEAHATRMQLDALRAQLHPHFLFNAMHTIVQLIPDSPRAAMDAAERLAGALRISIEERRDLISLAEEWAFVERYLSIERIRFGERLRVDVDIAADASHALLPSFALQTLVENAVRHGAATRIEPTRIAITASLDDGHLVVNVGDDGDGADPAVVAKSDGTGLRRLRERLLGLYGGAARFDVAGRPGAGFTATLIVPLIEPASDAADDE